MSEPARKLDVRVGSSTDALTPVSRATRSFAATRGQWLSLAAVALAAIVADQMTKWIVASNLELGDGVHILGPFWIRHVQNSGIAFGFFPSATAAVIVLTARRGGVDARVLRSLGRATSGSPDRARARDRRQHLESRRPVRLGHVTDFLDFRYWPAFNLADSFIVIGVGMILAALVLADRG